MKVLVTGANGFIGKNLVAELKANKEITVMAYDLDSSWEDLKKYTNLCDFVFHLAGVNRPKDDSEFQTGNVGFTEHLLCLLKKNKNQAPVLMSSSIQAELENSYGISKRAGEDVLKAYGEENKSITYIYRLPNVFGKWCSPNYNSAIATFCYNIANGLEIQVSDRKRIMNLVYIDDVINEFLKVLFGKKTGNYVVTPIYEKTLGEIVDLLHAFRDSRQNKQIPNMSDGFTKKLYSAYLSYLPIENFGYAVKMNTDNRGSFTEFVKSFSAGQVSVNVSKPGIIKGNHWHHSKIEKFLVVSGEGVIRFRHILSEERKDYHVSEKNLKVIDVPPGYTHSIVNTGSKDLITIIWCNENFDSNRPDTYFEEV
ncbi:MAG: NAD-dependent epimerase/dehydratase family protein [Erysipelotrichales bacterium]|nr:NAD-dependent epimerase/dehydratase family protein [Erysipelotrichales bacterium]